MTPILDDARKSPSGAAAAGPEVPDGVEIVVATEPAGRGTIADVDDVIRDAVMVVGGARPGKRRRGAEENGTAHAGEEDGPTIM